ncbi:MAG: metallophosphoesterase [Selenomonadaceae bacterium]|nr:metallophosphoesterase [Selenomonadaceae bacterium]MBQ3726888.1 metallophosphoesterase [Selenomonadaceae bacterium]
MNRRTFIKLSAVSVAALMTGCGGEEKTLEVKFLRQIVTKNISGKRLVMWQVDVPLQNPSVEVSVNGDTKIFPAQDASFTDDGQKRIQYAAQIDSGDVYRIVDGEAATAWHEMKNISGDDFKAIIFSDSQCGGGYDTWGELARQAIERNSDADFFVDLGDIVDNGEDTTQWEDWFAQIKKFAPQIPFAPVMGNHETYSREWTTRTPEAYLNYFATPDNGDKNFSRRFYSFEVGAAHFAVLDSQWDELGREIIDAQKNWLRRDLSSTDKPWKIIFVHKDVLQYRINGRPERPEGFSDVGKIFMPEFESLGVDAVFTGHLHTYRNRGRLKNFQDDETGPLYILSGLSGNVRYSGLWINHALDKTIAPQPETDNYLVLAGDDDKLSMKCFLPDGELIDEVTLKK